MMRRRHKKALTGLEREKLENEHKELLAKIAELKAILADEKLLLGVIRKEILIISDKYGDERRSSIGFDQFDISMGANLVKYDPALPPYSNHTLSFL